jgi:LacI family transcriptional regulator
MSFVGCDDVAVAEFHEPQIALVRRDTRHLGEIGAQLLLSELGVGEPPPTLTLPTKFAPGPSCAPPLETATRSRAAKRSPRRRRT